MVLVQSCFNTTEVGNEPAYHDLYRHVVFRTGFTVCIILSLFIFTVLALYLLGAVAQPALISLFILDAVVVLSDFFLSFLSICFRFLTY